MNQSSDAAEQIVRMSLEGFEVAAKVTGSGAKDIAVLLYTVMKNKEQTSGKSKLSSMLKSGKPLTIFTVKKEDLAKFQQEAKRYGILYCAFAEFNKAEIISNIEKTRENVNKGKEQNPKSRVKKKEDNSLNPNLAKTEKSPLSKPFSEVQKTSPVKGNVINSKKPSVKAKLDNYKKEVKIKSENKEININKIITKSKGRTK